MPERNAVNSERGDKFGKLNFAAIRNAGASRFTVTNTATGEVLTSAEPGARVQPSTTVVRTPGSRLVTV
ncbi:MAG: hypothetical protein ACLU9S_10375 [Oscillospiraceae bacterium]